MRRNKLLFLLFFVSCMLSLPLNIVKVRGVDSGKEGFDGMAYDGTLSYEDPTYNTARDASTAQYISNSSTSGTVGQRYVTGVNYTVWRSFLYFNTSTLGDEVGICDIKLRITITVDNSATDFLITVQNGQPDYPSVPLTLSDFDRNFYSGNYGSLTTNGISVFTPYNISLSTTEVDLINRTGITKLTLRSSREISGTTPGGQESVDIVMSEDPGSEPRQPKLFVEWRSVEYTFEGLYSEDTGLFLTNGVNVTAYFVDGSYPETFLVNGTYFYVPSSHPSYFMFDLSETTNIVSQYGLNNLIYNQSSYYDILFAQYEEDINYDVNVTLTWSSTYTISNKALTGCRVNFGTPPSEDRYMNWYVYRQQTSQANQRQYWVGPDEATATIYIFEATTTIYTINFLDLANVLDDYSYVSAQYYINGTLRTMEKRRVDEENKIQMNLVNGRKYNIVIEDGASYTFGDLTMTSTTTIQLTLTGVNFPKDTLLIYKNIRIYGTRAFGSPNGNITITYEDTLEQTVSVDIYINYKNGTNAYNATETTDSFVHTWASALNSTDYRVVVDLNHTRYGEISDYWKQYFPRIWSESPWSLAFLGGSGLPFVTTVLIPSFLIVCAMGCFSVLNAEVGAFAGVVIAGVLTYLGWIDISAGYLITAFTLAILMGLIYAKRRVTTI